VRRGDGRDGVSGSIECARGDGDDEARVLRRRRGWHGAKSASRGERVAFGRALLRFRVVMNVKIGFEVVGVGFGDRCSRRGRASFEELLDSRSGREERAGGALHWGERGARELVGIKLACVAEHEYDNAHLEVDAG
jgi:hypothetical protein